MSDAGCAAIIAILVLLGCAIWLVEWIVATPPVAISIAVVAFVSLTIWAVRGIRRSTRPEARERRRESVRLLDAQKRVKRLQAEAEAEALHAKLVKDRLKLEAEEDRLRAEIDATLELRMRG